MTEIEAVHFADIDCYTLCECDRVPVPNAPELVQGLLWTRDPNAVTCVTCKQRIDNATSGTVTLHRYPTPEQVAKWLKN